MIRSRGGVLRRFLVPFVATALFATACGGGGDEGGGNAGGGDGGGSVTELTAIIPFPSGISFYPLFVAQERGYFGDDISVNVEVAEGTAASLQQVLTGQAEMCLCSPGPVLQAVAEGEGLVSVYTLYQSDVFALVTEAGEPIENVEELRGQTIGVDAREAGAESWLVPLLSAQGLEAGEDYEITAVGSGATPIAAFERDEIAAYAAAYVDVAVMELRGFETERVDVPGSEVFFDATVWMREDFVEDNPEVVEAVGRGLAMASAWGMENPEGVLEITGQQFAEEVSDMDFALALVEETEALWELPESAEGQWGYSDPDRVQALIDALVAQGYLEEPVDPGVFTNEFVEAFNDFEESDL
ncbi:ABC transporter substrate-binding protein [Geodermatophilus sp. DF01-2]|uniref:ABC transporter substrate-binding protein n=1 Tax=Geodermatophilus sp. DF01-2 TaxID=2559610 RepID=UPI001072FA23|nr:ABC transporter substrate-binding protein [Geodermatophilus sp. DF01_2]TFV59832.1 ABC transporter substrate-binding protein [Geodermatophilus sp. DF01_2]